MVALVLVGDGLRTRIADCEDALDKAVEAAARKRLRWFGGVSPDLLKYLERLHDAVCEFDRLLIAGGLPVAAQHRLARILAEAETCLPDISRKSARRLLYEAQMLLLEVGDEEVICGFLEIEKHWNKTMTSLLTWDALYPDWDGDSRLPYRTGQVSSDQLEADRHKLLSLFIARRDGELAYAARAGLRTTSLNRLSLILLVLLSGLLLAYAFAGKAGVPEIAMLPLAGGLGAALSGTLKTRDAPIRETELERVRSSFYAQLLVGAVFGVIVVFILQGGLMDLGGVTFDSTSIVRNAVASFIAGFSEPFALRTVERVGRVVDKTGSTETNGASRDTG